MLLSELVGSIDNSKNILQLEKMKKRQFNAKDRTTTNTYSHLILVMMNGGNLPQFFSLNNGVTRIKVRPYIKPVRQCFTCLRFGHIKDSCKRYKVCNNCGRAFHGTCTEKAKCINCGNNHMAMNKNCVVFQENMEIKRLIAKKNILLKNIYAI